MFYQRDGFDRPSAFLIILEDKSMIVKIGAKEIEMTSSALTSLAYKKLFGQDILATLGEFKTEGMTGEKASEAIEKVGQLGFIMAKQASGMPVKELMKLTEVDFYEWIDGFTYADLYDAEVVAKILAVWTQNLGTNITGKNVQGEAAGR